LSERDAVVVGAGVIGLTTACVLGEGGWRVRLLAAAPPQQTTSRAAAAIWGPSHAEPEEAVTAWGHAGLAALRELARVPESGVHMARGLMAWHDGGDAPTAGAFPQVPLAPVKAPPGYAGAIALELPLVDMPRYLDYLLERSGAALEIGELDSLDEVQAPLVVNCAGIGAGRLVDDSLVRPVRGQHLVVSNPGVREFFLEEWRTGQAHWTSWWPHGDVVVIGGTADEGNWSLEPDPRAAERMLERAVAREPRLRDARVIEHRVGLRPVRPTVRLEAESLVGRVRRVHNYGHGRSGVSLSWGCARAVLELAQTV
jgi:D-amino-acid oxidase